MMNRIMIHELLNNRYFVGGIVPVILLFTGALAKKIVRSSGWQRSDFFLGIEFTLAAMTSGVVYFFELAKDFSPGGPLSGDAATLSLRLTTAASFVAASVVLLLIVLSIHQDNERPGVNANRQFIYLGLLSNVIGFALLSAFILIVKGV
jgi:hypothetical protein